MNPERSESLSAPNYTGYKKLLTDALFLEHFPDELKRLDEIIGNPRKRDELVEAVNNAVSHLTPKQILAIKGYYSIGESAPLGISREAARNLLARARRKLREHSSTHPICGFSHSHVIL